MKESSDGETLMAVGISKILEKHGYMIPDLGSSRGESTTSKISFSPGNVKECMHMDPLATRFRL